jgi:transcriptional regulator with XRE-family HTH domain
MSAGNPAPGVEGFWAGGRRRRRSGPNIDVRETAIRDLPVWDTEEMRFALRSRDIAQVYGLLQRHGVSQRRIAAHTGQSQSEISEILAGRRVNAYDVLVRIAEGLGVPRGWLGLAHVDVDAKPTGVEVEMSRIEALPFPADVRLAVLRAFISGLSLAVPLTAMSK